MKVKKIMILLLSLIVLPSCGWFNKNKEHNVIISAYFKPGSFAWNAISNMVDKFNEEVMQKNAEKYDNRLLILKNIEINGIDKEVNAGYYGIRKLPNLFISYADEIINYSNKLKWHKLDVKIPNLKPFLDESKVLPSYWQETTYNDYLYSVPIGKSLEKMFINKKLLLMIFQTIGLEEQSKILKEQNINIDGISWKPLENINWGILKKEIKTWSEFKDWQTIKEKISTWDSFLDLMKITSYFFEKLSNLNQNEVYAYSIDDLPNNLYAWYANEDALVYGKQQKDFLFYEDKDNNFVLNLKGKSKEILNEFLSNTQKLKDLKPRTISDIRRIGGYHVKVPSSTSLTGTFSSTLFKENKVLAAVGSTSGIQFFFKKDIKDKNGNVVKGLEANDILITPLPFKTLPTKSIQQGPGLSMFESSELIKNEIAEKFIKFMLKPANNEQYAFDSGYLPINYESYSENSEYGKKFQNPEKPYLEILKQIWEMIKIENNNNKFNVNKDLQWPKKSIVTASPPLADSGGVFRRTLLKTLNIFYQDLINSTYEGRAMKIDEFFSLLKQQLKNDGINDAVIDE